MTNLEYYGFNNLKFEHFIMDDDNFAAIKISYVPKHADEDITLFSRMVYRESTSGNL